LFELVYVLKSVLIEELALSSDVNLVFALDVYVFNTPSNTIVCSLPSVPAIHLSLVLSHNNEPDIVFGDVASLTTKPALVAPVPFNDIMLSPISKVVELTVVFVPLTNKLPLTVTLEPVNSKPPFTLLINVLVDEEKEFNDAVEASNEVNLLFCVVLVVLLLPV
jgi:hypothetical protein